MKRSLQSLAGIAQGRVIGNPQTKLERVASLASAKAGDLVFVEEEKNLSQALESNASAVIAGEFAAAIKTSKPLLIAANPRLAFAHAAAELHPAQRTNPGIHSSATVHRSARLHRSVSVGASAVIAEGVEIGESSNIGAGAFVGRNVKIGKHCKIAANVSIYEGTTIGDRAIVHAGAVLGSDGFGYVRDPSSGRYQKFPQVGVLVIGDDVEIGANTTIDRGALDATVIGRGVKLDNLVHVGHNVRIGENVVIAAQTGISGSVIIEDNVIIGGQVGIADHARVEEGVILGAQSGIPTSKIVRGKGVVFWGTPARPLRGYLKELAALARLSKEER